MSRSEKMKKLTPLFIVGGTVYTLLVCFLFFFGIKYIADGKNRGRVDLIENVVWKSSDPVIDFSVPSHEELLDKDYLVDGTIKVDDEIIEVKCFFAKPARRLIFYYKDIFNDDEIDYYKKIALQGDYDKVRGNRLVIKITEDNIYNEKYETITFNYEKLD